MELMRYSLSCFVLSFVPTNVSWQSHVPCKGTCQCRASEHCSTMSAVTGVPVTQENTSCALKLNKSLLFKKRRFNVAAARSRFCLLGLKPLAAQSRNPEMTFYCEVQGINRGSRNLLRLRALLLVTALVKHCHRFLWNS